MGSSQLETEIEKNMNRIENDRDNKRGTGVLEINETTSEALSSADETPGGVLEARMLRAATSEALSLAWISESPSETLPGLLEKKHREARLYVRRQQAIKGKTERIIAMAF